MTTRNRRDSNFLAAIALLALAACGPATTGDTPAEPMAEDKPAPADTAAGGFLPPNPPAATHCGQDGMLQGEFVGALAGSFDASDEQLACEGMPRPEGRGARLRFAISDSDEPVVALIISIPELTTHDDSGEFASVVTLIDERQGRFFSSADLDTCWTEVERQHNNASADQVQISGELFCIAPLAEINGSSSVSITELRFSGLIDWGDNS